MTVLFSDSVGVLHCEHWQSKTWIEIEDEIYLDWGKDCMILDVTVG